MPEFHFLCMVCQLVHMVNIKGLFTPRISLSHTVNTFLLVSVYVVVFIKLSDMPLFKFIYLLIYCFTNGSLLTSIEVGGN